MWTEAPHVVPYQGSKRKLASKILELFPKGVSCLYEPFAGSAAITLAAAANGLADKFVIADKLEPLADLWSMIINDRHKLVEEYSTHWHDQQGDPKKYFLRVRQQFNKTRAPSALLFLIARCVKNSIRFNNSGDFNQGPDNRRLGLKPEKLAKEVDRAAMLLRGIARVECGDFRDVLRTATRDDLVYMDPPWQGTSGRRDPRYAFLLDLDELVEELRSLNVRGVPFMLSFDGTCGDRTYGKALPQELLLEKFDLVAGRSTQATLLGRNEETVESLYLSRPLVERLPRGVGQKPKIRCEQKSLFDLAQL